MDCKIGSYSDALKVYYILAKVILSTVKIKEEKKNQGLFASIS